MVEEEFQRGGKRGLVVLLLAERAASEGPRSTGAVGPTRSSFTLEEMSKIGIRLLALD